MVLTLMTIIFFGNLFAALHSLKNKPNISLMIFNASCAGLAMSIMILEIIKLSKR